MSLVFCFGGLCFGFIIWFLYRLLICWMSVYKFCVNLLFEVSYDCVILLLNFGVSFVIMLVVRRFCMMMGF